MPANTLTVKRADLVLAADYNPPAFALWAAPPQLYQATFGALSRHGLNPKSMQIDLANGRLTRTPITLLADEGDELEVDATVFVPDPDESWPAGALFLGYGGLLERVRFALDPSANEFHFGEA